ncbi:hypothetical protein TPHA_0J00300 [Tetrapisispora phaffii CBS 4417]|uniref:Kinesin motor domain-containing protein n=1 Tax=Tetrapisispora phaffii (strain ATCC 24235 / CBS 4417 / NBRC 1672 / NRRL Y-8282 / UCD 70-5) TaxID=1071381 RepID=G8BYB1_TETPH|nr:hypothetical protein TPHA_0J00300 [Tetrapisispora phaffii CBS 4417]CCE64853.1 hypothetical protein TPHA_0J00300 [Tetrapisispora phaffii CBS 4417]
MIESAKMENITVAVRCREPIDEEKHSGSPTIISIGDNEDGTSNEVIVLDESTGRKKIYTLDAVYGEQDDQKKLFDETVIPFYKSFFDGYNVSIMSYGSRFSGKNYTLYGEYSELQNANNAESENLGVVPRVLSRLFKDLESNGNDHIIKCSFVEIYNDELRDLLIDTGNNANGNNSNGATGSTGKKLRIVDSASNGLRSAGSSNSSTRDNSPLTNSKKIPTAMMRKRMGKRSLPPNNSISNNTANNNRLSLSRTNSFSDYSLQSSHERLNSIYIQNLQEITITEIEEGMAIIKKGLKNRRIASTGSASDKNEFSKRSHSIFNITLYKEEEVNEVFRMSKLSFVNFAGSEYGDNNTSKNGAFNSNLQSFNKMINGMVNNSTYASFLDSKLTQLLQNNFDGITRTLFIANIAPLKKQLDATCSVLTMATKIKEIKNEPKKGSVITKESLIKILSNELVKTKSDLLSYKSNDNGIYMDEKHYSELTKTLESYKEKIQNSKNSINELTKKGNEIRIEKRTFEEINERQRIKLQNLRETISNLNCALEKQSKRESELENIKIKLHSILGNMQKSVEKYSDKEIHLQNKLKLLYDKELVKLKNSLESNFADIKNRMPDDNDNMNTNIDNIKAEILKIANQSQSKVKELLTNSANQVLDTSPKYFEQLDTNLKNLEESVEINHNKYSELLSDISEEFNNLNNYINDNFLKSSHEELIDTYINRTYHEVQGISVEFTENFKKLLDIYVEKNTKSLSKSITSLTSEIVENELTQFNPEKKKWELASNEIIENFNESITKNKNKNSEILAKLLSESTSTSELFINNMSSIKKNVEIVEEFSEIFNSNDLIKSEFLEIINKNKKLKDLITDNFNSSENSIDSFDNLKEAMQNVFKNEMKESYSNDTLNLKEIFEQMEQQKLGVNSSSKKKAYKQNLSPSKISPIKSSTKLNSPLKVEIQSLSEIDMKRPIKRKLNLNLDLSENLNSSKMIHKE